jgi:dihydrofolate reductase
MNAIVAVDSSWAIGIRGDMLVHNPIDMKFFREKTKGHVVVMGRKTLESFPGKRPLKNRVNVVLSASLPERDEWVDEDTRLICVSSREALFQTLKAWPEEEIFLIGGGMLYRDFLPECQAAYVTYMDHAFPEADTWYPNLDEDPEWELAENSEWKEFGQIRFAFRTYRRKG